MEYEKFFNLSRSDLIEPNPFYKKNTTISYQYSLNSDDHFSP